MPTPARGRRRRTPPPLGVVAWLLLGLCAPWAGWAADAARGDAWMRPVPGRAVEPFAVGRDPFAAGQHRGVDLRARPGRRVESACAGRVRFAGRVPRRGRVVTVACGRWRVTYLPLGSVAVRRGAVVSAGAALGTVGAGHRGLHVGVRRAGRRFGYVDPERFFRAAAPPVGPVGWVPRTGAPPRAPVPGVPPRAPVPLRAPRPAPGVAPWPVWAGLGLVLAGACVGLRGGRRRRSLARDAWARSELREPRFEERG